MSLDFCVDVSLAISKAQADAIVETKTAPRVTKEKIEARIKSTSYLRDVQGAPTLTICSIVLDNGYSVRGESACVDPANYDRDVGARYAYDDAFRKLWPLFGFLLAEDTARELGDVIVMSPEAYEVLRDAALRAGEKPTVGDIAVAYGLSLQGVANLADLLEPNS